MNYAVSLTSLASSHIDASERYIAWRLEEPAAARRWKLSLLNEISKLESLPARHPIVDREPWRTRGLRRMSFGNFLIYYVIDEGRRVVSVTSVVYGGRDQDSALEEMDCDVN